MSDDPWEKAIFGARGDRPKLFNSRGMPGFLMDDLELGLRVAVSLDVEEAEGAQSQYWWLAIGNEMYEELIESEGRAIESGITEFL